MTTPSFLRMNGRLVKAHNCREFGRGAPLLNEAVKPPPVAAGGPTLDAD